MYICICYIWIYGYILGILYKIFFFFWPLWVFSFSAPSSPGCYVASAQRFLPRVVSLLGFVPLSSPASACDVTRCVRGDWRGTVWLPFKWGFVPHGIGWCIYHWWRPSQGLLLLSFPILIMSTFWCCCLGRHLLCPGLISVNIVNIDNASSHGDNCYICLYSVFIHVLCIMYGYVCI